MIDLNTLTMTEIIRLQNQLQHELARRFERSMLMVFSDIVGSTPYFARFGDAIGRQLHQLHYDLLDHSFGAHQGRIVDSAGDGVFSVFPTAQSGVRGVVAFHQAMAQENATRARAHQLSVRIGLHWGSVLTDGAAVTGDTVNLAARVAAAADPGSIYVSRQAFQELDPVTRLHCHSIGSRRLKGVEAPVELMVLDWRDPTDFPRRVRIEETGEEIELPQQDIIAFGRLMEHDGTRANDIVLNHPEPDRARLISRWHFELRRVGDGLRLRALTSSATSIDGQRIDKGVDVAVRSGSQIRVADTLTLVLVGDVHSRLDDADSRTMILKPEG